MGNEQSTQKGVTQNGKVPEKHKNGSANGVTAIITPTGIEIDVNSETKFIESNEPFNLDLATESPEPDFVVVDSVPAEAQVVPEIIEAVVQVVEAKKSKSAFGKMFKKKPEPPADVVRVEQPEKSNEDVTDQSPAAADPQPELNPFKEEEAAVTIVTGNQEEVETPGTADTSTQTDAKVEVDIATQTDEDEDTTAMSPEDPADDTVVIESVTMEESLDQCVVIAEEAVEEEASDYPTCRIIGEEVVVMEDDAFENIMFRADLVEVIEIGPCTAEDESFNGPEETEPEIATEPESDPNRCVMEEEDETVSLEVQHPKVVADFMELVFSSVSVSTCHVAVDEAITEENAEEAGDMSADVKVIGTTEADVITPEPQEENGAPSLHQEIVTPVMETICEETNPENQDTSGEEPPVLTETVIQVTEESARDEVTSDEAVAPETGDHHKPSPVIDDEPSEKCGEEEISIVEVSPSELIPIQELPEDEVTPEMSPQDPADDTVVIESVTMEESLDQCVVIAEEAVEEEASDYLTCRIIGEEVVVMEDDTFENIMFRADLVEVIEIGPCTAEDESFNGPEETEPEIAFSSVSVSTPETTPEIINAEISEGPETVDESEPSPAVVPEGDEVIPEAAIDLLAQEFAVTVTSPQEPEADHENLVEEEVITATVFMPLSAEQEVSLTVLEEPVNETSVPPKDETAAERLNEEAIEALSNELESVPESPEEETAVQESATEEEIAGFNASEEPEAESNVEEEKTDVPEDVPAQTESIQTPEQIILTSEEPAEEHPSACEEDATTEVLEKTLEAVVEAVLEKLEVTEKIVEEIVDVLTQNESIDTSEQTPIISVEPAEAALEKLEVLEDIVEEIVDVLAQNESIESSEQILSISEEPAEENPSPSEDDATTQMLDNTIESVVEAVSELLELTEKNVEESEDVLAQTESIDTSEQTPLISVEPAEAALEKLEVKENIVEEPEDVAVTPVEASEESEPSVPVQEEEEEKVAVLSESPAKPEVLMVISDTTEDEVATEIVRETNNSVEVPVENSDSSEEPVAEGVKAVLETIEEELVTEEATETSEAVALENDATESTADSQSAKARDGLDLGALREKLQSACASVVEESTYSLGGLEILTQGNSLTISIHVAPKTEQQ